MARLLFKGEPSSCSLWPKNIFGSLPPYLLVLIFLMLPPIFKVTEMREARAVFQGKIGSCCSFPCKNGGICVESCNEYSCDCAGTHHFGKNCQYEMLMTKIVRLSNALWHTLDGPLGLLKIVDSFDFLHSFFYNKLVKSVVKKVQEPKFSSIHCGISNNIFHSCTDQVLLLSPVPPHCPTPLGTAGFQILPPLGSLFDLVLKRCDSMHKSKGKVNLLFVAYAQFLAKQMSGSNNVNWLGSSGMYGNFERTHCQGKISRTGSPHSECCRDNPRNIYHTSIMSDALQNIVLREHNRICDLLHSTNPGWSDQRLYETATHVVAGEIITITSTEWLPFLKDYRMRMKFKSPYTSVITNKVPHEVILAMFWPQMYPDTISIGGSNIGLSVLASGSVESLHRGGTFQLMKTLAATCPGKMGTQNVPAAFEENTKKLILEGRRRNLQSFNNYRVSLGLRRCKSFAELTGDPSVLLLLQKMYGDIEGLELIPGLLLESPREGKVLGDTMTALISDLIFKAAVTHPLTTTSYLKKSTFGGNQGWEVVKNANIKNLICQNVNEGCCKEVDLTFGKKSCNKEPPCGKKNVRENVKKLMPKKIIGLSDKDCTPKIIHENEPTSMVPDEPPSPKLCEKIETPHLQPQKQHCTLKSPPRTCNKPKPKPDCHVPKERTCQQKESSCKEIIPPEVKQVKKCCNRRPWFRTRK
uniref:Prostaglandin G/H synthase 2 n=1 Tax=Lygus hesperus TaxID=30085 RepID=A0A0A9W2X4_LYGHE